MKKILAVFASGLISVAALGQTFPSPTFNSLTLQNPLTAANGGTGASSSTGSGSVVLSNSPTLVTPVLGTPSSVVLTNGTGLPVSTGVSGLGAGVAAGLANAVTGSGSPVLATSPTIASPIVTGAFTATGLVTTADLATQAANSILGNATASTASPTAVSIPSCSGATSALQWTSGTGFGCNTAIQASTATTASTSTTASVGTNSTAIATTAFVVNHSACKNIMDFGGDPTNTNDNSSAFSSAVSASRTGQVCIEFPPGTYKFATGISYTNPSAPSSITIKGSGQDVTVLTFPNATSGITVTSNSPGSSAHIQDLSVTTGQNGGFSGISLVQTSSLNQFAGSDITRVTLRGSDNNGAGGSHYWTNAVNVSGQDQVNVEGLVVYGSGVGATANGVGLLCSGNGTQYAIYVNISKSLFNDLGIGVVYGSYCQGITITQSNFQNDAVGFETPGGATGVLSQLQISDSQFATANNAITIGTAIGNVMIHHNDIFVHTNTSAIFISPTNNGSITGNNINSDGSSNTGTNGIVLGTNAGGKFTVGQNQIAGLTTCIWYQSGSSGNVNLGNALSCTTPVVDQGTSNSSGVAVP